MPNLDLTCFTDDELGAQLRAYARLAANEDSLPWLRRFAERVCTSVGHEQGERRTTLHAMAAQLDGGLIHTEVSDGGLS